MHSRDLPPDSCLIRLGLIDYLKVPDTVSFEPVGDRGTTLSATDNDDVMIHSGTRTHPISRVRVRPTLSPLRLGFELRSGIRGFGSGYRTGRFAPLRLPGRCA